MSVTLCETPKGELTLRNSTRCKMRVSHSWCASGQTKGDCDGIVTKDRANWRKTNETQKTGEQLTDSWQRDLAELMSVSEVTIYFFKTAGFNRSPTPPFLILAYSAG